MFKHPGKKIKSLAIIFFIVLFIVNLLAAFGITILISSRSTSTVDLTGVATIIGIIAAVLGFFISWISVIFMYAFGSLVEDVEYIKKQSKSYFEKMSE